MPSHLLALIYVAYCDVFPVHIYVEVMLTYLVLCFKFLACETGTFVVYFTSLRLCPSEAGRSLPSAVRIPLVSNCAI